jgi:hypothetical protein
MHIFTSVTANYLPKAAALAQSIKRIHSDAVFHVVLCDRLPACPRATTADFDSIINVNDLPIDDRPSWIFKHRLVELCTGVKGTAFQYIAEKFHCERIYYFDPDIVVLGGLDDIDAALDRHSVVVTPHLCAPEIDEAAIVGNEISCLKHGVYNLGFLGVRMTEQGRRFLSWWSDRLRRFCYDEIATGLFTDQRWVDLAPALFDDIAILRDPRFNVATWNLTHRRATGRAPYEILINGRPLVFYHFSGLDSGDQQATLERDGRHSPVLFELRDWYIARCAELGQRALSAIECVYDTFSNGEPITDSHRTLYRRCDDLIRAYPDPFNADDPARSYFHWFEQHGSKTEPRPRPLVQRIKDYTPPPALRLARSARSAFRRWSLPA